MKFRIRKRNRIHSTKIKMDECVPDAMKKDRSREIIAGSDMNHSEVIFLSA